MKQDGQTTCSSMEKIRRFDPNDVRRKSSVKRYHFCTKMKRGLAFVNARPRFSVSEVTVVCCCKNIRKMPPKWAAFFDSQGRKSALAELGSATGSLQAVFFVVCRLKPLKTLAFFASASKITSIVTSKMGILFEPKEFCDQFVTATPISAEYYLNYIVCSAAPISLLMQIDLV